MITLNLKTSNKAQEQIKEYLEQNVSEPLAEKINNGVQIVKDNKTLLNKKDLDVFWKFATDEARKIAEKGSNGAYVDDETVYGWAIHYFEEDSLEGKLFNADGTEYKSKVETQKYVPKPEPKKEEKKPSLFDFLQENAKSEEKTQNSIENITKIENKCDFNENYEADPLFDDDIEEQVIKNIDGQKIDTRTGEVISVNNEYINTFRNLLGNIIEVRL